MKDLIIVLSQIHFLLQPQGYETVGLGAAIGSTRARRLNTV